MKLIMNQTNRIMMWLGGVAMASAAVLVGCGGGVGTGGTGTYSYGPISGFGSIIVGGIRYDESSARIEDDEGQGSTREQLKLGMMVSIDSDKPASAVAGSSATATTVRFGSVLMGPLTSANSSSLVALGQTVLVTSTTVIDDSLGTSLAALAVGRLLEVHGFVDTSTQNIVATRIEGASATPSTYKVRGFVNGLDTTARTLRLGGATFGYASAVGVPAGLANGQLITLRVLLTPASNGDWRVSSFGSVSLERPDGDRELGDARGLITSFISATRFAVNGVNVDATGASFPDGTAGIVLGARVKVEGRFVSGAWIATKVEIENDERLNSDGFDVRGAIESVQTAAQTLRVRGTTVFYGGALVRFEGGTASDLVVGRQVRVRGVLSVDRTRVNATRIEFVSS